jgi:hypothetical protein
MHARWSSSDGMAAVLQAVTGSIARASLLLLANAGCAGDKETCEGAELEEVIDALSDAHKAGGDCAIAVDLDFTDPEFSSCVEVAISEAQERRARMSRACQQLYDDVSEKLATGSGSTPGGTQCSGGVCCDDTGCYGG